MNGEADLTLHALFVSVPMLECSWIKGEPGVPVAFDWMLDTYCFVFGSAHWREGFVMYLQQRMSLT